MSNLYGVIGSTGYTNLLSDPAGADKITIPVEPGYGVVNAGTVMYRKATGLWAPAAAAQVVNTNQLAVLKEAVDAGEAVKSGETGVAEDGLAYRAGRFIDGVVTLADGAKLEEAHKVILRGMGLVLNVKDGADEFDNTKAGT